MAVFFFVSGFFTNMGTRGTKQWLIKRIRRILIPYILWSIFYFVLEAILNGAKDVKYYIVALMLGNAAVPFYYIVVLMIFTILTPPLFKNRGNSKVSFTIFLMTITIQSVGYVLLFNKINLWGWIKYTPVWLAFYYGGMLAKQYRPQISVKIVALLVLVSVLFEIGESQWMMRIGLDVAAYSQYRISGFLYSFSLCLACLIMENNNWNSNVAKIVSHIGDDSFALFFVHSFFIMLFEHFIPSTVPLPFVHIIELAGCLY